MQYCIDGIAVKISRPKIKSSKKEDIKRVAMLVYTLGQIKMDIKMQKKSTVFNK